MQKTFRTVFFISFLVLLAACSNEPKEDIKKTPKIVNTVEQKVEKRNDFTLVAKEAKHTIAGIKLDVFTYGGSIPGTEIRVKQGEKVKITLKNELKKDSVTIHWHGYPVPNNMDGVPGVTQNAVKPGETFVYEFVADTAGTYWYHSHQHGAYQVDKGLYGTFIVEEKEPKVEYDVEKTLVLDEWSSTPISADASHSHGTGTMDDMYDLYTINGKSGEDIEPLTVKEGQKVRLRIINSGFISKNLVLEGHEYKVIATDGQEVQNPTLLKDKVLKIGSAERFDIEFTANNPGTWKLKFLSNNKKTQKKLDMMELPIQYENQSKQTKEVVNPDIDNTFDLTKYGLGKQKPFTLHDEYDVDYNMDLNTTLGHHTFYTINNAIYPLTEDFTVKTGDTVKVTFRNLSQYDEHPMHLHGHFFQVLSKNGVEVKGSPIFKDTINLEPGDTVVIAFRADNKGRWMFHCHDLHHASSGMVAKLIYTDFTPDPNIKEDEHNIPE